MENVEIAAVLKEVADLLEIQEANPFRVRAYRNAVRTIEAYAVPLRKLVEDEADLTELPAIGKGMAQNIEELVTTGGLSVLNQLAEEIPASLIELMRLPGLGPKKARKLWNELGIETMEALEEAATEGRIEGLAGFGQKTQARILEGIAQYRTNVSRFRLVEADELLPPLLAHLEETPGLHRLEVAGSYRRRLETIGDIDLLALADDPEAISERLVSFPAVVQVLGAGATKTSVTLRSGLQVDLRVVPPESWGAALVYFTGSKEHGIKLRQRALDRELRISEYGVFRIPETGESEEATERGRASEGERVAGTTEEAVYEAVGLPWIPPEIREDRGEIPAAESGELPRLLELEDLRGDLQMHSTWSDGRNSLEEMLEACAARGYEYFAITDHSKALAMIEGLDAARLEKQWVEIDEIAARHPEIRILRSMEVDILRDGTLDLEDEMLAQLDLVVISIHSYFGLPQAEQTERVLRAVRHPEVNILAHPTGRLINRRPPIDLDVDEVLRACVESGVAVELNAQPSRLDLKDTHVMRARELGLKVAISTDAHRTAELDLIHYGVEQARRAWLTPDDVLNALPLSGLLETVEGRQA
jgi:DNA polymerase (family 10)